MGPTYVDESVDVCRESLCRNVRLQQIGIEIIVIQYHYSFSMFQPADNALYIIYAYMALDLWNHGDALGYVGDVVIKSSFSSTFDTARYLTLLRFSRTELMSRKVYR